ncbi:M64 family metallopeptidase [Snuella sedimenti]|uniref:T9SS type A sorting domain-containing protein n=1 Tax=Snuella sedimenti TaxID=2798802 RepID=A0A8J7LXJ2_9FLAO|nr:M64 family metallopeptidase [Snuella sedimenti]MBJ6366836.1 T9SS type A sorting domain-containing protein [Snuella sedimenti]
MKQALLMLLVFIGQYLGIAQTFDVETIKYSGEDNKRINLVILSEGYQEHELAQFITVATEFTNAMFNEPPFLEYANYFNVYAIKVPSNESGADHPGTATDIDETAITPTYVDTYFNATYDAFGTHRLLYYEIDGNNANNTELKITTVLANNFPNYDKAVLLVNSDDYGGSGGEFPMFYSGNWGAATMVHELGHALFDLKDEYYPGDLLAGEAINMTQVTDPNIVRWKNWLGSNEVGIYQYYDDDGFAKDWYKPHQDCIMEKIEKSFCSVCKEGGIEKIHSIISPINDYSPSNTSIESPSFPIDFQLDLIHPIPNTLETTWTLNSNEFATNVDAISILESDLNSGNNNLTVVVHDATSLLRVDNHTTTHIYTVNWSIDNSSLGVSSITSEINNLSIALYPNPTNTIAYIKLESKNIITLKVELISLDGKKIKSLELNTLIPIELDIEHLSQGTYIANFYTNNVRIASKRLIKI